MAAGIYGDMMAAFPEIFQSVPYYVCEPEVGGGYKPPAESGYTDVIIMADKTFIATLGERAFSADSSDVLDYGDREFLWAPSDTPLRVGYFVYNMDEEKLYRIVSKSDWERYGGFIRFGFEIVQGETSEPDRETTGVIKGSF
jgi:hypothetical protein